MWIMRCGSGMVGRGGAGGAAEYWREKLSGSEAGVADGPA